MDIVPDIGCPNCVSFLALKSGRWRLCSWRPLYSVLSEAYAPPSRSRGGESGHFNCLFSLESRCRSDVRLVSDELVEGVVEASAVQMDLEPAHKRAGTDNIAQLLAALGGYWASIGMSPDIRLVGGEVCCVFLVLHPLSRRLMSVSHSTGSQTLAFGLCPSEISATLPAGWWSLRMEGCAARHLKLICVRGNHFLVFLCVLPIRSA